MLVKATGLYWLDRIVHVSEGWMVEAATYDGDVSPKDHPARKEVIFVAIHTENGTVAGVCPISPTEPRRAHVAPLQLRMLGGTLVMQPKGTHGVSIH